MDTVCTSLLLTVVISFTDRLAQSQFYCSPRPCSVLRHTSPASSSPISTVSTDVVSVESRTSPNGSLCYRRLHHLCHCRALINDISVYSNVRSARKLHCHISLLIFTLRLSWSQPRVDGFVLFVLGTLWLGMFSIICSY